MNTRILTLTLGLALGATALFAQYPTIPDSVKARGAAEEAVWNQLDQVAWQKAVPVVMEQMLDECYVDKIYHKLTLITFKGNYYL